jgi:hypothetical protein
LKNLSLGCKSLYKVEAKEGMVSEKVSTVEKKQSALHQDDSKKALRMS